MNKADYKRITNFLFEVGTMRKLPRMHRQTLLTDDITDTIASHSYRVALIGWLVARSEGADPHKTAMMCLVHDMDEARSGDHNWVHKRYVKIFEKEIREEQLGTLPFPELKELSDEYHERKSNEAIIAKDADILDQILLLKEYVWQGNKEARIWLEGKPGASNKQNENQHFALLKTETARNMFKQILKTDPSDWWNDLWTSKRR